MSYRIHLTPEVGEAFEQAADGLVDVVTVEVIRAKVGVLNAIAEHMVGSGEHGGGHGEDGATTGPRSIPD